MAHVKLGMIGCGSIGRFLLKAVNREGRVEDARFTFVVDIPERLPELNQAAAEFGCAVGTDIESLTGSDAELVVESAAPAVARRYAPSVLASGKDMLIMSVGSMVDAGFREELLSLCRRHGRHVYAPSGAIGGLDAVRAAMGDRVDLVRLTTRKPPRAIEMPAEGAPPDIDLDRLTEPTVVFEGPAEEAIRLYPKNVNVSVTLSLVGLGPRATRVRLVADPSIERNIHEVEVEGAFGRMTVQLQNLPMPENPKTSYLAGLSALATLQRLSSPLQIGG